MIESVDFWPRVAAESFLFTPLHAVISITCPNQAPARIGGSGDLLRLSFYDLTEDPEHPDFPPSTLFTEEQAQLLHSFLRRLHDARENYQLVVHCEAGVSRSAAVALVAEAYSRCAFPTRSKASAANARILEMCGDLLGFPIAAPAHKKSPGGILLF